MPDLENIIPIVYEHLAENPIGIVKQEDGRIVFKFNDRAKFTEDDINKLNRVFVPMYQISKVENGYVKEVELIALKAPEQHP